MRKLISWLTLIPFVARFLGSRVGIGNAPHLDHYIDECTDIVDAFCGLHEKTRIVGAGHVPVAGPLIVAANHYRLDDPCVLYHTTRMATGKVRLPRIMMRDDFFSGRFFESRLFNSVDFFKCLGAHPISRDKPTLSQMKPFVKVLDDDLAFLIFPGRTRSRSGLLIEYRDNFTEPGGVSFFVRQAQRRRPDCPVPTLPAARSHNPVTGMTTVVYGEPVYLDPSAGRDAARDFDIRIVEAVGGLFEVSMPHLLAAVFALRAIERGGEAPDVNALADILREIHKSTSHPWLEPLPGPDQLPAQIRKALAWFQKHGMIRMEGDAIRLNRGAIRHEPELSSAYRRKNPVKFLCNQILHLDDVLHAVEASLAARARSPVTG